MPCFDLYLRPLYNMVRDHGHENGENPQNTSKVVHGNSIIM
jgi:hypothetical protein